MIRLEPGVEGPYNAGYFDAVLADGKKVKIRGKESALLALILAGYTLNDKFHPLDAFTPRAPETV